MTNGASADAAGHLTGDGSPDLVVHIYGTMQSGAERVGAHAAQRQVNDEFVVDGSHGRGSVVDKSTAHPRSARHHR